MGRAQEGLYVDPGYNPVSMLQEKPTLRWKGEAAFLEVADAALILEAARVVEARDRVNAALTRARCCARLAERAV